MLLKDLRDILFPKPMYCLNFADRQGQDVLCRVRKIAIPLGTKIFFCKLLTGTRPVKIWMQKEGVFVLWDSNCSLFKFPDAINTILIDCWDAILFWELPPATLQEAFLYNTTQHFFSNCSQK